MLILVMGPNLAAGTALVTIPKALGREGGNSTTETKKMLVGNTYSRVVDGTKQYDRSMGRGGGGNLYTGPTSRYEPVTQVYIQDAATEQG